ncbi:hypothetical protein DUNSADRAFT_12604 [Dunaliella salina]|uniref:Uncharacterized protein n=1 Tax=Dunaliella salina TaxID=3046 RepID=A0ABQ7GAY4_DUNSA|nr:hypothetical protein DUNSADRAFT_12604 [Dunaliella salina]|eukprot:KAF5831766.1 hypothetical protein DUNSADRAFT_12604 [Dunaliella salina]
MHTFWPQVRVHSTKAKRRCAPLALLRHHTKEVTCVRFAPMAPPRQASQVPPCIDEHAKCVCMDCERKNAERVLERRPGSGAEKVASVLGKVELVHGRVQEEGQGFVGQESVQAPGCSDARVEDASGDQGACSDKYGMRMLELTSAPAATVGRRGKDAGGDQGACSKEHGEEGEPGKGNLDDEVASGYGHGSWGEGPISARHGTLLSASRDGSIAVWHVFPP